MPNFRALTILFVHYSQNYAAGIRGKYHKSEDCFEYPPPPPKKNPSLIKPPKKYLPNFPNQKKSGNRKFQTLKSASIIPVT